MDPQVTGDQLDQSAVPPVEAEQPDVVADQGTPATAEAPDTSTQDATADFEAREKQLREEAERNRKRVAELEGEMSQATQWLQNIRQQQQQAAEEQRYEQWWNDALEQSHGMSREDAHRYLTAERRKIDNEKAQSYQRQIQMERERQKQIARPLFINKLVEEHGLGEQEKSELESLENPNDAARLAPVLANRSKQLRELEEKINQLSRTQVASQMQSAGLGAVGGTTPPGSTPPMPEDPDEQAIWHLHYG